MSQTNNKLTAGQVASAILNGGQLNGQLISPALRVCQPIGSPRTLVLPSLAGSNIINISPNGVGLLIKMYAEVQVTFTVPPGTTLTRAPFGESNLISQITFTDLNQLQRHSTSGKHLTMLNTAKSRSITGAAYLTDTPLGFGSNFNGGINICPATIAGGTTQTISIMYEVPIMYQNSDFRGAIYLGTTQATATLGLTLNNGMFSVFGADPSDAVYSISSGGNAPTITNVTVTPYMEYFDQLPQGSDGMPLLPISSMQQIYQLIGQVVTGPVANTEFAIPFANLRNYVSAIAEYDNGGVLNPGTDINYWAQKGANLYSFWQKDPLLIDYQTRRDLMTSFPNGTYYFNFREQPVNTLQFGNQNLIMNAKSAAANAVVKMGWEFFSTASTLAGGGSIQSA